MLASQTVLSVSQLNQLSHRVTHRAVIVHHTRFHGLDEPTLDVTRLGGFDGGINETLTSSHGVEVELAGRETGQVGVLYESTGLRTVIVL